MTKFRNENQHKDEEDCITFHPGKVADPGYSAVAADWNEGLPASSILFFNRPWPRALRSDTLVADLAKFLPVSDWRFGITAIEQGPDGLAVASFSRAPERARGGFLAPWSCLPSAELPQLY